MSNWIAGEPDQASSLNGSGQRRWLTVRRSREEAIPFVIIGEAADGRALIKSLQGCGTVLAVLPGMRTGGQS